MKVPWSTIVFSAVAVVICLCAPVRSEEGGADTDIAEAVAGTTTVVAEPQADNIHLQQAELAQALSALAESGAAGATRSRGVRCYYNCPPPVGSVTASPQVVDVPAGALGFVTIHWRWDQSSTQAVTKHSCLWVSRGEESEAHIVQCERPGHTYATTVGWVAAGNYIFRVAPGNPKGPFTKPVAGLFQLAQAIVVGTPL